MEALRDRGEFGAEIQAIARSWIGTPYRHQCSVKGHGADCLGLLRGVWREVVGDEPVELPCYTADWSEVGREERLWRGAQEYLREVDIAVPGDVLLFRMQRSAVAKHLAIRAETSQKLPTIIHAYSGRGVVETPLTHAWRRRAVAAFAFPLKG